MEMWERVKVSFYKNVEGVEYHGEKEMMIVGIYDIGHDCHQNGKVVERKYKVCHCDGGATKDILVEESRVSKL